MTTPIHEQEKDSVPFYPNHFKTEFYVVLGILALVFSIGIIGIFDPVGLQAPADPLNTPQQVKPEWYFLALYQLLKYIPGHVLGIDGRIIGVMLPVIALIILVVWPFFDKKQDSRKAMRNRAIAVTVVMVFLIGMTIWGKVG